MEWVSWLWNGGVGDTVDEEENAERIGVLSSDTSPSALQSLLGKTSTQDASYDASPVLSKRPLTSLHTSSSSLPSVNKRGHASRVDIASPLTLSRSTTALAHSCSVKLHSPGPTATETRRRTKKSYPMRDDLDWIHRHEGLLSRRDVEVSSLVLYFKIYFEPKSR